MPSALVARDGTTAEKRHTRPPIGYLIEFSVLTSQSRSLKAKHLHRNDTRQRIKAFSFKYTSISTPRRSKFAALDMVVLRARAEQLC